MARTKDCKGSVRFETNDPKAPITNVYVSRAVEEINTAKTVTVTLTVS